MQGFIQAGATGPKNIHFKDQDEADRPFLKKLYESIREKERLLSGMGQQSWERFIADQFRLREADYARRFPQGRFLVLERKKKAIGRMIIQEEEDRLHLVDVGFVPKERGKGLGSALMALLIKEAEAKGKFLTLFVDETNPEAYRFYLRHGFRPREREGAYLRMERPLS